MKNKFIAFLMLILLIATHTQPMGFAQGDISINSVVKFKAVAAGNRVLQ
ncbi:MAG TPA: hypothetical protein VIO64_10605 [Pseudobacteroides sp.]